MSSDPEFLCKRCKSPLFSESGRYQLHRHYASSKKYLNFFRAREGGVTLGPKRSQFLFFENLDNWGLARQRQQISCSSCGSKLGYHYKDGPEGLEPYSPPANLPPGNYPRVIPRPQDRFKVRKDRVMMVR